MKQDYYVYHLPQILIRTCSQLLSFLIMVNSVALSHVWYRIITNYLEDQDIYHLCMAFPIFKEMFPRCEIICYNHQINHRVTCSKCFMRFKSTVALWQHVKKYKEVDLYKFFPTFAVRTPTRMYKCSICREENLPTKKSLKKHLDNDHKVFHCSVCSLDVHGYCCLRKHLHDHHNVPKGFACTTCKKQFYRKSSLRKHQKTHYICSAAIVLQGNDHQ